MSLFIGDAYKLGLYLKRHPPPTFGISSPFNQILKEL